MTEDRAGFPELTKALVAFGLQTDFQAFCQRVFHELLPGDVFRDNWHIDALCHEIMQTIEGKNQRLVVTVPPRSLKSLIISVALPAFVLGRDPSRRIVCISYSDDLSAKMAADFRKVVNSSWYRQVFPKMAVKKNTDREITTTRNGGRFATSVGGTLTGRGGNLFIIDDPLKPADAFSEAKRNTVNDWLRNTLASRPDNKRVDKMILVMQRVHVDDPAGVLLATGQWQHLNLPAIAERDRIVELSYGGTFSWPAGTALHKEREPLEILTQLRTEMGDTAFSAQYLQRPVPLEGGMFKPGWIRSVDEFPHDDPDSFLLQSWDTALTVNDSSNWSVCTTWLINGDRFYLMEVNRRRLRFPELVRHIAYKQWEYKPAYILVEYNGVGIGLIDQLEEKGIKVTACKVKDDKVVRAGLASSAFETGRVFLPEPLDRSLEAFLEELFAFPHGKNDDQVDSMSLAINWWEKWRSRPTVMIGR